MTTLSTDPSRASPCPSAGGVSVVDRLLQDADKLPGRQPVLLRLAQLSTTPRAPRRELADLVLVRPRLHRRGCCGWRTPRTTASAAP